MIRNFRELYQYRELVWSLTLRELKARYRGSSLGFLWTFLNPMLLMAVYGFVFGKVMHQQVPNYTYFMFVGLLPWIFFSSAVAGGASSISDRRDLLTKVRFPAQVLPTTVMLVNLCNYLFSLPLMVGLGVLFHVFPDVHALFFPLILGVQVLFTTALAYLISALNVTFRDLQHIIGNVLTLWFFGTPVVYQINTISEAWRHWVLAANPMAVVITSYQAIFYTHSIPNIHALSIVAVMSLALFFVSAWVFESRREDFAELV